MIFVRADPLNRCADIGRTIVLVVPQQKSGNANSLRRLTGRFGFEIGSAKKASQFLNADAVAKDPVLAAWCDLADDRRRIANSRRVIQALVEQLEVPVVKIDTRAICRFRRTGISEDQIGGERDHPFLKRVEQLFLGRIKILAPFPLVSASNALIVGRKAALSSFGTSSPASSMGDRFFNLLRSTPSAVLAEPCKRSTHGHPARSNSLRSRSSEMRNCASTRVTLTSTSTTAQKTSVFLGIKLCPVKMQYGASGLQK
jgi:hypothetical protein